MTLTLYMSCNTFICTILFGLLESSKITVFKGLVKKIIEAIVAENSFFLLFFVIFVSIISRIKSLIKVILDDFDRPNRIAKMNGLYAYFSVIVI